MLGRKIYNANKILSDKWHIPGETKKEEETDEEALVRGIKEEAGIQIKVGKYLGFHKFKDGNIAK